jgi:sulfur relay protein TusB/DsrH
MPPLGCARPSSQAKGARVYVVQEDLDDRGITRERCVAQAQRIPRAELVGLMEAHDQVWHW